jgi:FMN phosphatase YigB (HAD superfamily)
VIRALFVDLDNTLFRTRSIPRAVVRPLRAALAAANCGPDALEPATLAAVLADTWRRPFDVVARDYALPLTLCAAWEAASAELVVTVPLRPYADVWALGDLNVHRVLVTTGFRRLQESKVTALGIAPLFDRVVVDALGEPGRAGKAGIFRALLRELGLGPAEALVVGDSADSEIAAGNGLGIPTVQVLRRGAVRAESATHHVRTLRQLPALVAALDGGRALARGDDT